MTGPRGTGRDLSALKKSPGLRALQPDTVNTDETPAGSPRDLTQPAPPPRQEEEPPAAGSSVTQRTPAPANVPVSPKRGTIAYLPAELKAQMEDAARRAQQTYTDWFLDQFDVLYDELAEEFEPPQQRRSPLPVRARARRRRVGLGPSTMVQLRLTREELAAIDERREQLGAPSRSEFVTRIIERGIARST